MAVSLGKYWEERLDRETRDRLTQFLSTLKSLERLPGSPNNINGSFNNPSLELSEYRSDLVKVMNTMEMIAIVIQHSKSPEVQRVLHEAYASSIKMRYKSLMPFITAYREKYKDDRTVPAWTPLDPFGNEPDS